MDDKGRANNLERRTGAFCPPDPHSVGGPGPGSRHRGSPSRAPNPTSELPLLEDAQILRLTRPNSPQGECVQLLRLPGMAT